MKEKQDMMDLMKRLSWLLLPLLAACSGDEVVIPDLPDKPTSEPVVEWTDLTASPDEWDGTKRADISYQLLLYSFADSDGDKWGDLQGVIDKLDYINSLGVSAIWLSPIHPSMSYHSYDVTDYTTINPTYGSMSDFDRLVSEADKRGIKIYLDYVMNHTGKEHPWFKEASSSVDSEYRNYYIFSQDPKADIASGKIAMIATEGENGYDRGQWFATTNQWLYHSHFWTGSFADLNYGAIDELGQSPVYKAMIDAAKGWIDRGVGGLRLDAVKHIYHNVTSDENPRFLHRFYEDMNAYYKQKGHSDDFYIIGEVLSEHNEVAPYYAGLPALFEFSFWYRLEWAINNKTGRYFAKDILGYEPEYAAYRSEYIKATKLSNHDEDRTASKLGNMAEKCKLAAAVLLTAPGSPYIYYGEELGLYGTKERGDEYVRGPMLWGDDYTTHYTDKIDASVATGINDVAKQQADEQSLLNTYLTFSSLRNTYPALAEGAMSKHPVYNEENADYNSIAAWYMTEDNQRLLVIHNFGNAHIELPVVDTINKTLAISGSVQQKDENGTLSLKLGKYASVVFEVK